jgi:hypothetical protein
MTNSVAVVEVGLDYTPDKNLPRPLKWFSWELASTPCPNCSLANVVYVKQTMTHMTPFTGAGQATKYVGNWHWVYECSSCGDAGDAEPKV